MAHRATGVADEQGVDRLIGSETSAGILCTNFGCQPFGSCDPPAGGSEIFSLEMDRENNVRCTRSLSNKMMPLGQFERLVPGCEGPFELANHSLRIAREAERLSQSS